MTADIRFRNMPKSFWADVRSISESVGYTDRRKNSIRVPTVGEIKRSYHNLGFDSGHLFGNDGPTEIGSDVLAYFTYRAKILHDHIEPRLMDVERAKSLFERHFIELHPKCPIPMNKQRGEKKAPAYFTGLVNMLIESHARGNPCDYDPRRLTTVTKDNAPLRTLARRGRSVSIRRRSCRRLGDKGVLLHDHVRQSCCRWCLRDVARWNGTRRVVE